MRTGRQLRRRRPSETVRDGLRPAGRPAAALGGGPGRGRRTRRLLGIFTDSDLARLFETRREADARPADRRGDDRATRCGSRSGPRSAEAVEAMQGAQDQRAAGRRPRRPAGRPDRRDRPDRPGPGRVRGVTACPCAPIDDLAARCAPIELLVVDVDGVLTDGVIAIDDRGVETKHFHVRDGSALRPLAGRASGRRSSRADRRAGGRPPRGRAGDRAGDPGGRRQGGAVPRPDRRAGARGRGRSATWATTWPTCRCWGPSAWRPAPPTRPPRSAGGPPRDGGRRRPRGGPRGRRDHLEESGSVGRAGRRYRTPP